MEIHTNDYITPRSKAEQELIRAIMTATHFPRQLGNGGFLTTEKQFKLGIMVCNECGNVTSIDNKFCKKCNQVALMVLDKYANRR